MLRQVASLHPEEDPIVKLASPFSLPATERSDDRPRDDELDLYGLTHPGRVRSENQDHFLLCTVHPQVQIHGTSLPDATAIARPAQRLATLMLVADGVGGSAAGSVASRLAIEAVAKYVSAQLRCLGTTEDSNEEGFTDMLRDAAMRAHAVVRDEAEHTREQRGMATTLSLGIVVWPWLYVVQVGDSRCYVLKGDRLQQLTRDQTVAQELIDRGALPPESARTSPFSHVLSSAIGAEHATPEVTKFDVRERGSVILVCTDGLTKHVDDEEIAHHLATMENAEQVSRALLQLALDRGGSDNITLVVGRALKRGEG
jgi:serine/threonine protein phosphatase PrpC